MGDPVKIAGVQGFYGDSPTGAIAIARSGAVDFMVHDALSELTLSILHKDQQKDPDLGYARDIEFLAAKVWPKALKQGMRIVTNAGGLNPLAAGERIAQIFRKVGVQGIKIAVVTGDNLLDRLEDLKAAGAAVSHLEHGQTFESADFKPTHASVYTGAAEVKEALDQGANIVLTGRVADPCLTMGIAAHAHGWRIEADMGQEEWDLLAAGVVAGHVIECGGQASGGNSYAEWPMEYQVSNLGYPIAIIHSNGKSEFTRLTDQGGKLTRDTVREQLVYEIHDPKEYITPDVTVDLSKIRLVQTGEDRVELTGVVGSPRPERLKLAMGKLEGFLSDQFFYFSWPYAFEKALKFQQAVSEILEKLPLELEQVRFSFPGINGIHGDASQIPPKEELEDLNEVCIRVAVFHKDRNAGKIALQSVIGLALNGPPGLVSVPGWGLRGRAQLSLWPALIDRSFIQSSIQYIAL